MTRTLASNLTNTTRFRVFYDGLCPLCSREISFYRTKDASEAIDWIDITREGFDAEAEGLNPARVYQVFHVKDETARIIVGVDAFIEIWSRIPALRTWTMLSRLPGARRLMKVGYFVFARIRPYLPRRARADCNDGLCGLTKEAL